MEYLQITCLTILPVRLFILTLDWVRNSLDISRTKKELGLIFLIFFAFIGKAIFIDLSSYHDIVEALIKSCAITICIFGALLSIEYVCKR